MDHFAERALPEELVAAKILLQRAMSVLDEQGEAEAACLVCEAIERLIGAPRTLEQWQIMTRRNADGSPRE